VVFGAVIFYQANLLNKADMDRQNVQEQLIKAKEVAEYAREVAEDSRLAQEQFLANMSHELRTPLNSMLILSRLLSDNAGRNLTEKQVEYSKVINKAGSDLLALINDILDLSKINSGKMELLLDQVSVPEIQNTVSNLFSPIALQKEIALSIHVDREVPDYICTDETRLGQILKNLLSNAFKFTEKGGQVSLRIQRKSYALNGNRKESCIAFAVGDTGIGIPEDKRQHIFDAFRQVDGSTSRKYGGTGLGLSISSKLVQLLGGTILLESELGRGSTFTILLPESPKAES
jgi:signal transduction histidine kinase